MRKIKKFLNGTEAILKDCPIDVESGILFDDGLILTHYHAQDCCENVYADWDYLKDEAGLKNIDFSDLTIEERGNRKTRNGIRICGQGHKFFVPCYNEQNGYYNDQLDIVLIDTNQYEEVEVGWSNRGTEYGFRYKIIETWKSVPTIDNIY